MRNIEIVINEGRSVAIDGIVRPSKHLVIATVRADEKDFGKSFILNGVSNTTSLGDIVLWLCQKYATFNTAIEAYHEVWYDDIRFRIDSTTKRILPMELPIEVTLLGPDPLQPMHIRLFGLYDANSGDISFPDGNQEKCIQDRQFANSYINATAILGRTSRSLIYFTGEAKFYMNFLGRYMNDM